MIHKLAYRFTNHENLHVRGYKEKGNINTPLELAILNQIDRFNLAILPAERSDGWEVGAGPSFVVVDEGLARSLTTTSAREDVYVFIFDQKGLMGGIGVQGSKISPMTP